MLYIYGNWKMNNTFGEMKSFFEEANKLNLDKEIKLGIAPSSVFLAKAREIADKNIVVACQNMHYEDGGAFTGETSPLQLLDMGITATLIGHSERRQYNGETDEIINKKLKKALEKNMEAIVCFGETSRDYDDMKSLEVITNQIVEMFKGIAIEKIGKVIFAYEPVWAIGTGRTATPEYAEEMAANTRKIIKNLYGETAGRNAIILYGGSVKGTNAFNILAKENVNGALVGGASLKIHDLKLILEGAKKAIKF